MLCWQYHTHSNVQDEDAGLTVLPVSSCSDLRGAEVVTPAVRSSGAHCLSNLLLSPCDSFVFLFTPLPVPVGARSLARLGGRVAPSFDGGASRSLGDPWSRLPASAWSGSSSPSISRRRPWDCAGVILLNLLVGPAHAASRVLIRGRIPTHRARAPVPWLCCRQGPCGRKMYNSYAVGKSREVLQFFSKLGEARRIDWSIQASSMAVGGP